MDPSDVNVSAAAPLADEVPLVESSLMLRSSELCFSELLFLLWAASLVGFALAQVYGRWPRKYAVRRLKRPRSNSEAQAFKEQPLAFLPDDMVGNTYIYKLITALNFRWAQWFHAYDLHSTHNQDIFPVQTGCFKTSGRAPRGLLHRTVFSFNPWCRFIGMVPGRRNTAKHMLREGFIVAVLPGGSEEAMSGHEHAYKLGRRWRDRKGFAHVAKDAGVKIYPVFTRNAEEMRFNPFFFLWNSVNGGKLYDRIVKVPFFGSFVVKQVGMFVWFGLSWWGIPVPVKIETVVGEPIVVGKDETARDIAERTRLSLQALVDKHQPHGHAYLPGLRERFFGSPNWIAGTKKAKTE